MNEAKHTPGPWYIGEGKGLRVAWKRGVYPDNNPMFPVAIVAGDPRGTEENEANAKLIAAAPALADVLERALRWIDDDRAPSPDIMRDGRAALRAAGRMTSGASAAQPPSDAVAPSQAKEK